MSVLTRSTCLAGLIAVLSSCATSDDLKQHFEFSRQIAQTCDRSRLELRDGWETLFRALRSLEGQCIRTTQEHLAVVNDKLQDLRMASAISADTLKGFLDNLQVRQNDFRDAVTLLRDEARELCKDRLACATDIARMFVYNRQRITEIVEKLRDPYLGIRNDADWLEISLANDAGLAGEKAKKAREAIAILVHFLKNLSNESGSLFEDLDKDLKKHSQAFFAYLIAASQLRLLERSVATIDRSIEKADEKLYGLLSLGSLMAQQPISDMVREAMQGAASSPENSAQRPQGFSSVGNDSTLKLAFARASCGYLQEREAGSGSRYLMPLIALALVEYSRSDAELARRLEAGEDGFFAAAKRIQAIEKACQVSGSGFARAAREREERRTRRAELEALCRDLERRRDGVSCVLSQAEPKATMRVTRYFGVAQWRSADIDQRLAEIAELAEARKMHLYASVIAQSSSDEKCARPDAVAANPGPRLHPELDRFSGFRKEKMTLTPDHGPNAGCIAKADVLVKVPDLTGSEGRTGEVKVKEVPFCEADICVDSRSGKPSEILSLLRAGWASQLLAERSGGFIEPIRIRRLMSSSSFENEFDRSLRLELSLP